MRRVYAEVRRSLLLAAAVLVLAPTATMLGDGSAGATATTYAALGGQGSTFAAVAFQTWTQSVQEQGLNVNYTATGSPAGLDSYADTTVDFAGSEAEFSELYGESTPSSHVPRGYAYAPDLAGGIATIYHVAATRTGSEAVTDLHLAPLTIARIFLGVIKNWDSPTISADNDGLVLPNEPITVDFRSGQSGTTALFYDFVQHEDPTQFQAWVTRCGFTPTVRVWENDDCKTGLGFAATQTDAGPNQQAQYVASATGEWSIGYVESSYPRIYDDDVAWIENASGNWVQPDATNIDAAVQSAVLGPDTAETLAGVYTSTNPAAYPLSFYSYLVYQCAASPTRPSCKASYADEGVMNAMAKFMRYIACTGQVHMAALGYAPVPPQLSQLMANAIGYMTGQAPAELTADNCNNPQFGKRTPTVALFMTPPSSVTGQPVTFATTVSSARTTPTGTVTFTTGSTTLCTASLSAGSGSCTAADAPIGADPITATYNGDTNFTPATATAALYVAPEPPPAPSDSTGSDAGTSTLPTGTASARVGGLSATATGLGSLTVATYGSNPTATAVSYGTGTFYDVSVAAGSAFSALDLSFCGLGGGSAVDWWTGSSWAPFSDQSYSPTTGCVSVTVDGSTSPTPGQLTGTPMAVVQNPPPPNNGDLAAPIEGMASLPDGTGYWLVNAGGAVSAHGNAVDYGSMAGRPLDAPITHIVSTPDGQGYWLVAADGGIFAFGDAGFLGSMGGQHLNAPVVDIAPTADGQGYWLVAADGGIFAFGDAQFHGSMGGQPLNQPVVAISADDATGGYWEVAADGGIFAFGAPFLGSTGNVVLDEPVNGMASTADGQGYWLVAADGGIFAFGTARFAGSTGGMDLNAPVVGMAADGTSGGYWLVGSDGGIFAFASPFLGAD